MKKFLAVFFMSLLSVAAPLPGGLNVTCTTQPNAVGDVFEYSFNLSPSSLGYYVESDSSAYLKNLNYKFDIKHLGLNKVTVTPEQMTLQGELTNRLEGTVTTNHFVVDQKDGQMVHRRSVRVLKPESKTDAEKDLFVATEGKCTIKNR